MREGDLVFVTTGSMTEDTAYGDDDTAPQLTDTDKPGSGSGWQLRKNLAEQFDVFGRPDTFCGNVPRSTWESVTLTCKPSPLMNKLKELSVNDAVFTLESSARTARTLNNDEPFLGEGLLHWILGGTYFEHILPLGPMEDAAQMQ